MSFKYQVCPAFVPERVSDCRTERQRQRPTEREIHLKVMGTSELFAVRCVYPFELGHSTTCHSHPSPVTHNRSDTRRSTHRQHHFNTGTVLRNGTVENMPNSCGVMPQVKSFIHSEIGLLCVSMTITLL